MQSKYAVPTGPPGLTQDEHEDESDSEICRHVASWFLDSAPVGIRHVGESGQDTSNNMFGCRRISNAKSQRLICIKQRLEEK